MSDATKPYQYAAIQEIFSNDRPIKTTPLLSPDLDPRNEKQLVEDAIVIVRDKSEQQLNDFTPGSPTRALLEGQAMVGAQLAYLANQVAHKAAIDFLQIAGIQKITGRSAQVSLFFRLTAPLTSNFQISAGYSVRAGQLIFNTDSALVIPPGATTGEVTATCEQTGTKGNVKANTITSPIQSYAFLDEVTNPLPAYGGLDGESEQQTISRGFVALRSRGLVSRWDYEEFTRQALGDEIIVKAYGRITPENRFSDFPLVTLAICHSTGAAISDAEEFKLFAALEQKKHPTVIHSYKAMEVTKIDIQAIVELDATANPRITAPAIWEDLKTFLAVSEKWIENQIISNELEARIYQITGVKQVNMLFFGKADSNLLNLDSYHTGRFETLGINNLVITLIQNGQNYVVPFGPGDPD